MTQTLTPYDTGERLEPRPWVPSPAMPLGGLAREVSAEDYGRVDFDDDENRTVLTAYVAAGPGGYVLHVAAAEGRSSALSVAGDAEAIVVGREHFAGLAELLILARRGRDDFLHQAGWGDYSDEDQRDADERWAAAQDAAAALRARLTDRHTLTA